MTYLKENQTPEIMHNMKGGPGDVAVTKLFPEVYGNELQMLARLCLPPKAGLGLHTHTGNYEVLYVVSGVAEYNDAGVISTLHAGDAAACPEGGTHCITNASETEDLVLLAVIPKTGSTPA